MNYKNVKVKWITISVYLGDEFKEKHWKENEQYTKNKLIQAGLNDFAVECPIEDLVCIELDKETKERIIEVYTKSKGIFDKVFVNLYLEEFIEENDETYNSVDISLEEYLKLVEE